MVEAGKLTTVTVGDWAVRFVPQTEIERITEANSP